MGTAASAASDRGRASRESSMTPQSVNGHDHSRQHHQHEQHKGTKGGSGGGGGGGDDGLGDTSLLDTWSNFDREALRQAAASEEAAQLREAVESPPPAQHDAKVDGDGSRRSWRKRSKKDKNKGKAKQKKSKDKKSKKQQQRRADRKSTKDAEAWQHRFQQLCLSIFQEADLDNTGYLSAGRMWDALSSQTTKVNISKHTVNRLRTLSSLEDDDIIRYEEYIPTLCRLVQRHSTKDAANDWFLITNGGTDGSPMYMNKSTGEMQQEVPEGLDESSQMETVTFEYITLSDGSEITTYQTEQGRVYMDWEAQEWRPFPQEWLAYVVSSTSDPAGEIANDPRFGEFDHPTHGHMYLYLMENTRNTYLYMDQESGEWHRIPLVWERCIPDVKRQLNELQKLFPEWTSINEQLLVLRECNYDLNEAIAFADINWNFTGRSDLSQFSPAELIRSGSIVASARRGVRVRAREGGSSASLSAAAARRIDELEAIVAEQRHKLERLQADKVVEEDVAVRQLVREKTRVQTVADRRQREAMEAQEELGDLQLECEKWRSRSLDLEEQVIKYKADHNTIAALREEVAALRTGNADKALKLKDAEIDRLRAENVSLRLRTQTLQRHMGSPSNSTETVRVLTKLQHKVQQLKREKEETAIELQASVASLTRMFELTVAQSRRLHRDIHTRLEAVRAKYLKEQMERKLLYNKVQELRGNIRVFLRVRKDNRGDSIFKFPNEGECIVRKVDGSSVPFEFDQCYAPDTTQERVFNDTKPVIMSCIDGYNVCIMAYGQTGSGKTYTMMGPPSNPGVNRRAVQQLFELCQAREEVDYSISVSLMEVYNEKLYDLLTPTRGQSLSIHASPQGIYVGNLTEKEVKSQGEIEKIMAMGDKNRSMAATKMNTDSSRSHLLLQLRVTGYNTISNTTTVGKLTLVDLAGSERVSKTEASGERLVEAAAINKSLSALAHVFKSLATNSPHVPYRNSKLTHVLQDSLGGDSKTCVFINVSPLEQNIQETHCTLSFGEGIRKIELGPATKHTGQRSGGVGSGLRPKKKPPPIRSRGFSTRR
ncbi:kinesin family member C3 [Salpingoeca rosetta]|uniref:Kinesin family member C3 n=1 Tax=Salpingoeca rosetta (strain ATCC 50818 / BSB-021) TaxID=946362 RepID=F2U1A6_SALR5|nr:kinesin family member C3 [Salpingoeca rosetta]EGD81408.1 kinesin family member C3 [Salpingoeca rosetta]|eukprot:XP_004996612.1 kinesin family member C3 [Salpingoeca rosetta]